MCDSEALTAILAVFGALCLFYATDKLNKVTGLGEQTE
jgi:hypothetical protein